MYIKYKASPIRIKERNIVQGNYRETADEAVHYLLSYSVPAFHVLSERNSMSRIGFVC